MTVSLQGYKVLITRPKKQGAVLCQLVNDAGGMVIPFPVIEIIPSGHFRPGQLLAVLSDSSHIIFISRNAVICTDQLIGALAGHLQAKRVFAVGNGTLQELIEMGVTGVLSPGMKSGSEQLLDLDELKEEMIRGRKIIIIRGESGRELLKQTLESRGAEVQYASVYRREIPKVSPDTVETLWQDTCPDVIVVTSGQGLQNLLVICGREYRDILKSKRLVVMSSRIQEHAKTSGFIYPAVVAGEQTDQGLLKAIERSVELIRNES